tara:strand:+ start:312 stop:923 length:612 start_codon:yes stop_codon:yes gene_type:complete
MSHRKIEYLNENRIIYKRNPVNDEPSHSTEYYDFYEQGTHEYYCLFNSKSKITSFRSLKWHSLVLCYLNKWSINTHARIIRFICDKRNGFTTFKLNEQSIESIIQQTFWGGIYAPKNKLRKIIFKDYCKLSFNEKMKIVGELLGRQKLIKTEDIYECMLNLNEDNLKITWIKIAKLLRCSVRTIQRSLNPELKQEKQILNEKI